MWRQICQHTGDVIKSVNAILPRYHYHFRTSQKRAVVKLLESYPAADFKANLILSRGKREKSLTVLQYLDYNMYSRSEAHKEAVRALRNGAADAFKGYGSRSPRNRESALGGYQG